MFKKRPRSRATMLIPIWIAWIAVAGGAGAQESTWIVTDGNWNVATNWNPQNVPNSPGESALIPDGGGAFSVTLDLDPTVDRIRILNQNATLRLGSRTVSCLGGEGLINYGILRANGNPRMYGRIENAAGGQFVVQTGYELSLYGAQLRNDGVILLNEQGTGDATINILADVNLSGTGELRLNGDTVNDRIYAYYGNTLTQAASHTIRGFGGIEAPLVNHGTVEADRNGGYLRLSSREKSNDGLFRATNGGLLHLQNFILTNTGGTILADGGDVLLEAATVAGGTIDRTGVSIAKSRNATLRSITIAPTGWLDIQSGYGAYLVGTAHTNNGTIRLNDAGSGDAWIDVRDDLSLSGTGQIVLNGDNANDQVQAYYGNTLTQEAGHTIRGFGGIACPLVNHGTVDADRSGGYLRMFSYNKSNDGLLRASNGGLLHLQSMTLQNADGTILADGGNVLFEGGTIVGGTIDRTGASVARGQNATLTGVAIAPGAWLDIPASYGVYLSGSTMVNDGTIRVNETGTLDSWIDVRANITLSGSGDILLNGDNESDRIYAYYGHTLTQAPGHKIHGFGGIAAPLVNHGTVDADRAAGFLRLSGVEKSNDGLLRASNGGELQIHSCVIQNAGGTIFADGGNVQLYNNPNIVGGTFRRSGSSVVKAQNAWITNGTIAADGWIDVTRDYNLYLAGSQIVNNGTIRVNAEGAGNATIDVRADLTMTGTGEILMNGDNQDDLIYAYYGNILTQAADHRIRGFGSIPAPLINHGTVTADRPGGFLRLTGSGKTNNGLLRASNGGELQIQSCTIQNAGGTIFADGGDVQLTSNGNVVGGTFRRSGASVVKVQNSWISDATVAADGWIDVLRDYVLYLGGSQIVNNGAIRLNNAGTGNAVIDVRSNVTLAGTGRLLLNGDNFEDYVYAYYGHVLTQAAGHTIHGKGRIACGFVNNGTVRADSANVPLRVDHAAFNNQGTCAASSGAQLQVHQVPQNYGSRTLTGGSWIARANSSIVLNNAPVDTANATILLDGPNSRIFRDYSSNSGLSGFAKIGPAGDFTIQNGRDFATAGNLQVQGRLNVGQGCTFTVPGNCVARYGRVRVEGTLTSPNPILIDRGGLYGTGTVAGNVVNTGGVFPGASTDTLTIAGNFTQGTDGRVVIELGGTTPDRIDLLAVTGQATLGGMLEIVAVDGHHIQVGDTYKVMTYGSRQGVFDRIFGRCLEPGICFNVIYNANDVTLVAYQLDAAGVIDGEGADDLPKMLRFYASAQDRSGGSLHLDLPQAANVQIAVYDVAGRLVATIAEGEIPAGSHAYKWDGGSGHRPGSGIFFARAIVRNGDRTVAKIARLWVVR